MANIYIRSGATGSGSGTDWTNALTNLPSTFNRTNTYYVADGTGYSLAAWYDVVTGGTATTTLVIKKATPSDHGTSTGWNDSFSTGQAVFTQMWISASYVTIDGSTGGGPTSFKSGHGFKLENLSDTVLFMLSNTFGGPNDRVNVSNIIVRSVEMCSDNFPGNCEAITAKAQEATFDSLSFINLYIHDIGDGHMGIWNSTNVVIDGCWMGRNSSNPLHHGVVIRTDRCSDWIIKNSWFEDFIGTGCIGFYDGSGARFKIYGNVFCYSEAGINPAAYADQGGGAGAANYGNGVIYTLNNNTVGIDAIDVFIYNNIFYNLPVGPIIGLYVTSDSTRNIARNNIIYRIASTPSMTGITNDYNAYGSPTTNAEAHGIALASDPFVDAVGSRNFRLAADYPVGVALASPYDVDPLGVTRGSDGTWNMGVFEFQSGSSTNKVTLTCVGQLVGTSIPRVKYTAG
jgi:hypothetical protein